MGLSVYGLNKYKCKISNLVGYICIRNVRLHVHIYLASKIIVINSKLSTKIQI